MDKFYTAQEVADILRITRRWLYTLIKTGEIKCSRHGREYLFTQESIDEYVARRTVQPEPAKQDDGYKEMCKQFKAEKKRIDDASVFPDPCLARSCADCLDEEECRSELLARASRILGGDRMEKLGELANDMKADVATWLKYFIRVKGAGRGSHCHEVAGAYRARTWSLYRLNSSTSGTIRGNEKFRLIICNKCCRILIRQ